MRESKERGSSDFKLRERELLKKLGTIEFSFSTLQSNGMSLNNRLISSEKVYPKTGDKPLFFNSISTALPIEAANLLSNGFSKPMRDSEFLKVLPSTRIIKGGAQRRSL